MVTAGRCTRTSTRTRANTSTPTPTEAWLRTQQPQVYHCILKTPPPGGGPMQADKKQILNRLASIEGHLRGIRKMVEDDQYCVDILKQSFAVERALKAFESALLEGHLASCVPSGFKDGRDDEMIRELGDLFELSRKKEPRY